MRLSTDRSDHHPCLTSHHTDWLTPPEIIHSVLDFYGTIDLDPCAESKDHPHIPAAIHYTKEDNGLSQPWRGKVFLNPPYGHTLMDWVIKGLDHYRERDTEGIIYLLPSRTDTRWFHALLEEALVCWCKSRLRFSGATENSPFPSLLVYLGDEWERFIQTFKSFGYVHEPTVQLPLS